jgi:hypothetical protein
MFPVAGVPKMIMPVATNRSEENRDGSKYEKKINEDACIEDEKPNYPAGD